jgi:SpoVK/Ycf46/Vps4 family AAA+-type ATPase
VGVLFIDEAYSLCRDKNDAFGLEAIDALVKGMEDNRDDLVVILAGYEDEMQEFLKANSGLKSRFPNVVHFEDYSVDEMCAIAKVTAASKGYKIDDGCIEGLIHQFEKHQIKGKNDGGNGRLVRNLIEAAVLNQSKRIINDVGADMELLLKEDFGFDKVVEFDLEKSLAEVIGMEEVKKFIRTQYTMLQANKRRKKANIDVDTTQSLNMIFAGNPGTGKTTMARIVADMFHSMDILKSGQLVEVDKGGLVAQYVGQTAKKTEEVFKSALGGVLFIDEAYSITNDGSSFGQECIDTLVKLIEDYRGEIVVILAGYSKEMKDFMKSNSGLESRFPLFVEFPDYSASELYQISLKMIHARGFRMDLDGQKAFENEIIDQKQYATENSGNGRMVRNLIDEIIRKQSVRVIEENVEHEETNLIKPVDIRGEDKLKNFDLEKELSGIIGLTSVKDFVRTQYRMCLATEKRRKADLKVDTTQSLNMIFAGNPGTGKTTIARVVAEMFKSMGILKKGQLIETDKTGLIAEYVGQTAKKTEDVFKSAIGGVLFIDEAYSITNDGSSFGQECIDTLVKLIEDHKGELIVILAGYSKENE